jgi:putative spermidine/putrescine transport system ATP-binding protein
MPEQGATAPSVAGRSTGLPAISVIGISKFFGHTAALDDVTLDVAPGEFITLLGPSGSGKTTLLNILAGFLRPSCGTVRFGGDDVTLRPPHKRDVGFVFQHYALFPHMTVGENVAFPLRVRRMSPEEIQRRVASGLELVQLAGFEERRVDQLSGGQKQRVALARAIVFEPKVILMDEPLSALDKQLRERMQIELRGLHERLRATTVYVTHDQREALTLSDRVAVLNEGRTMQVGTPEQLYEEPENSFVADFVGETTLLQVERAGEREVRLAGRVLRTRRPVPNAEPIFLAVRTEKLLLDGAAGRDDVNRLVGRVKRSVYQGESVRLFVELGDGSEVSLRRMCERGGSAGLPAEGEEIGLTLPPENTVVVTG